jgi:UDP-N-acetylmuramyl pentapeptide synthase
MVIDLLENLNLDSFLVGSNFMSCDIKGFKWFATSDELSAYLIERSIKNKTILLKGSRMAAMEKLSNVL